MKQILVSEDALNSIKAMAQKLQEENDRMRELLNRCDFALNDVQFPLLKHEIRQVLK
jgi:hypothetical protein